jgi:hypothetical protein
MKNKVEVSEMKKELKRKGDVSKQGKDKNITSNCKPKK